MCQNTKTQNITKLKNSKCDKTQNLKIKIKKIKKLKYDNSKCDKPDSLKI